MSQKESSKPDEQKKEKHWPYIKLAKAIVTSPHLNPFDVRVYCVIASYYNSITSKTFPSIPRIAKEAHLQINTIKKSRKTLRELGLIKWRVDKTEKKSCQYELPLITGSYEEQQRIIEVLRSGRLTPLPGRGVSRPPNKKKEQEEINNKHDVVYSLSLLIQKQVEKQKLSLQEIWEEWGISPEKLAGYKLLDIILWTKQIQSKISNGHKVRTPAGYLFDSLKEKREVPEREEKIRGLLDKFIPALRIYDIPPAPRDPENEIDYRDSFLIEARDLEGQEKNVKRLEEDLNMSITEIAQKARTDKKVKKRMKFFLYENAVWARYFEQGWYEIWRREKGKAEKLRGDPAFFEGIKEEIFERR